MRIIAGLYKNRVLEVPKQVTRPTLGALREALFNICQLHIEHAYVLDLFAGSGAIGLEALSRGAAHVTFVEKHRNALEVLRANIAHLDVAPQTTVYPYDVMRALKTLESKKASFDIIYIDPPYGEGLGTTALLTIDQSTLLKPGGMVFVEESPRGTPQQLPTRLSLMSTRKVGRAHLQQWG